MFSLFKPLYYETIEFAFDYPGVSIWLDSLELIDCRLDISDCRTFLILMSGLLGEPPSSTSFLSCFVIDKPLIILGDAIDLTGDDGYFCWSLYFFFSLKNVVAIGNFS